MIPAELAYQAEATTGEGSIWHPERHTLSGGILKGKHYTNIIPIQKKMQVPGKFEPYGIEPWFL